MKTTIKILICATLLAIPCLGLAQSGYTSATDLDVNGIFIGGKYTKAQVTAKWGTPTEYWSGESEFGLDEEYYYTSNLFRFSDNGVFVEFGINNPDFVVYKSKSGGFKVGDPVSRLYTIGLISYLPPLMESVRENILELPGGDDWFKVGYKSGKIIWISYVSSV
jgi:hypothetical protein